MAFRTMLLACHTMQPSAMLPLRTQRWCVFLCLELVASTFIAQELEDSGQKVI